MECFTAWGEEGVGSGTESKAIVVGRVRLPKVLLLCFYQFPVVSGRSVIENCDLIIPRSGPRLSLGTTASFNVEDGNNNNQISKQ